MSQEQATEQREAKRHGRECPLCLLGMEARGPGPLYGVDVCRTCRTRFTNLRQLAYLIDTLIFWSLLYGVIAGLYGNVSAPYAWTVMISLRGLFAIKDGLGERSPGKLVCGLQVVGAWGQEPIGPWKSFKRNVLRTIPLLNVLSIAIGVLTMEQGQRLGDRWARTKVIWRRYRWRTPFTPDDQHCGICGYDLTGNVSGQCPECGRNVPRPPLPQAYCPQCGYDVSDNLGGWCPACGR